MNISKRGIQRIVYNEVKPLDPLKLDLLNHTIIDSAGGRDKENGVKDDGPKEQRLKLFEEEKLASRFKDEEIKGIIETLEEKFTQLGKKYFLSLKNKIEFKRANNIIKVIIELTEKEQ
jgi:hypothetical protein